MQIATTAKRTFTGCLMCIDHFGNLLIFDAFEDMSTGAQAHDRRLNQIIIPLNTVQAAQVLVRYLHLSHLHSVCQRLPSADSFLAEVDTSSASLHWPHPDATSATESGPETGTLQGRLMSLRAVQTRGKHGSVAGVLAAVTCLFAHLSRAAQLTPVCAFFCPW